LWDVVDGPLWDAADGILWDVADGPLWNAMDVFSKLSPCDLADGSLWDAVHVLSTISLWDVANGLLWDAMNDLSKCFFIVMVCHGHGGQFIMGCDEHWAYYIVMDLYATKCITKGDYDVLQVQKRLD
jgi:hypothetical protein